MVIFQPSNHPSFPRVFKRSLCPSEPTLSGAKEPLLVHRQNEVHLMPRGDVDVCIGAQKKTVAWGSIRGFSRRLGTDPQVLDWGKITNAKLNGMEPNTNSQIFISKEVRRLMFTTIHLVLAGKVASKKKETNFLVSHGDPWKAGDGE